jgi:hypothetical protein
MSIPYNNNLRLCIYQSNPTCFEHRPKPVQESENQVKRAVSAIFVNAVQQPFVRGVQFIRDVLRLILKVPIRAVANAIFLEKNWQEKERAQINAKLTGYAFVQLVSVPAKFAVSLVALGVATGSKKNAKWILDTSEEWTAHLDGRASQLEALKEEGAKKSESRADYEAYRAWLYHIDAKDCRG